MSNLPTTYNLLPITYLRKLDSWIDNRIEDIAEEAADHRHEAAEEDDAHDHVVIAVDHGIVVQEPHAVDIENFLDKERAGKHERTNFRKTCRNRDKRIAKRMAHERLIEVQAFGQCGAHVVAAQFLQSGIFHEEGEERKLANHVAEYRERQMLCQIKHLAKESKILEVVACEAAQREYIQV